MFESKKVKNTLTLVIVALSAFSFAHSAQAAYKTNPMTGEIETCDPDSRWVLNPSNGKCQAVSPNAKRYMNLDAEYEYH